MAVLSFFLIHTEGPSSRRDILQKGAAIACVVAAPAVAGAYEVPDLLYPFEALEPYIDAPTMKIHHDKHHATYVANINKAMEGKDEVDILELQLNALEATPIRNSGVSEECISYVYWYVYLFISLHIIVCIR